MKFYCKKCGAEVVLFTDFRLSTYKLCSKCAERYKKQ